MSGVPLGNCWVHPMSTRLLWLLPARALSPKRRWGGYLVQWNEKCQLTQALCGEPHLHTPYFCGPFHPADRSIKQRGRRMFFHKRSREWTASSYIQSADSQVAVASVLCQSEWSWTGPWPKWGGGDGLELSVRDRWEGCGFWDLTIGQLR